MKLVNSIAELGRAEAHAKKKNTRAAIRDAQDDIERDIEKNGGIYPFAGGALSTSEVLRRAGLSPAALQKKTNHQLRSEVNLWVEKCRTTLARGTRVVRKAVTERADEFQAEIKDIRQRWVEAELEYVETAHQNAGLRLRIVELERENARLRASIGGENVRALGQP